MQVLRVGDHAQQVHQTASRTQGPGVQPAARRDQAEPVQLHHALIVPVHIALAAVALQQERFRHVHRQELLAHLTAEIRVQMRVKNAHDHRSITSTL